MSELEDEALAGSERIVSRPKSAKRALPDWSIRTLALIITEVSKIEAGF